MSEKKARIKAIMPAGKSQAYYAAYLPDADNDIEMRVERLLCWSLISFTGGDPDEVVGQIVIGDQVVEVTYPDAEEGFGNFFGYFPDEAAARAEMRRAIEAGEIEDEDDDDDEDEDEDEDDDEDDEEDEG